MAVDKYSAGLVGRVPHLMQSVRVYGGGGVEALTAEVIPVPEPGFGQVLVKVDTTTVISSEIASREGVSTAKLPLTLGNEFVGRVVASPDGDVALGTRVVGGYGGYGYVRDGAWAEYICVDTPDAFPIETNLDSIALAAIPASFTAASGSLRSLGDVQGRTLLIRGGTSGVGLAIATLASAAGAAVISTTRDPQKRAKLLDHGVRAAVLDGPDLREQVQAIAPGGVDLAVDLLGLASLPSTFECVREYGTVCLTGLLQDQENSIRTRVLEDRATHTFPHVLELIPPTLRLTTGGVRGTPRTREMVQDWVSGIEQGRYRMPIDSVFDFQDMQAAHLRRKAPEVFGKIIIRISEDARRQ
jgi:NADPH:quinone reductase-like Zn-dependent oxidoreductase